MPKYLKNEWRGGGGCKPGNSLLWSVDIFWNNTILDNGSLSKQLRFFNAPLFSPPNDV